MRRILVTHVLSQRPSSSQLSEMAQLDAVLDLVWYGVETGEFTLTNYAEAIRTVGARHFVLSSDLGQEMRPLHTDGLKAFIEGLGELGIGDADIDVMIRRNPARLLGLDP